MSRRVNTLQRPAKFTRLRRTMVPGVLLALCVIGGWPQIPQSWAAENPRRIPEILQQSLPPVSFLDAASVRANWPPFAVIPSLSNVVVGVQVNMRFGASLAFRPQTIHGKSDGWVLAVGMPRVRVTQPKTSVAGAVAFFHWSKAMQGFDPLGMTRLFRGSDAMGQSLDALTDLNGDGLDELLIGAPSHRGVKSFEGAWVLDMNPEPWQSTVAQRVFTSGVQSARLGVRVADAGDVNGDGFHDVLVGAHGFRSEQHQGGAAFLFLGSAAGITNGPAWIAYGMDLDDQFGRTVAAAGDVNGDGYDDVLVGAPKASGEHVNAGRVYLFLGSAAGLNRLPAWTVDGLYPLAKLGWAMTRLGDINGDGRDDVILGAPGSEESPTDWPGAAYIYLGSEAGLSQSAAEVLAGDRQGSMWGDEFAAGGDVNGDHIPDLLVGAPKASGDVSAEGQVALFLGRPDGLFSRPSWVLRGGQSGAYCGAALRFVPDLDGDGCDEFLVGSPRYTALANSEGRVDLLFGSRSNYVSDRLISTDADVNPDPSEAPMPSAPNSAVTKTPAVPPWMHYSLGAGMLGLIAVGMMLWRRRGFESQEVVAAERQRLARDLHDDLGGPLTRITVLTELVRRSSDQNEEGQQHAQLLAQTAKEILGTMEQVIWSVNPANDTLENLVAFIVQYAGPFLAPSGVELIPEVPASLPEHSLPANLRKNVFLCIKESLNNIVKHSGARRVWLRVLYQDSLLTIEIEDDGRGLGPLTGEGGRGSVTSDGLRNMKGRMTESGGSLEIHERAGGGVRVTLKVKLT